MPLLIGGNVNKQEILKLIADKEHKYQIPKGLLEAIVWQESKFDIGAVGKAGEIGLGQLLKKGAIASWEKRNPALPDYFDPEQNLEVAAWYLGYRIPEMLKYYEKPINNYNRITAYNAGIGYVIEGSRPQSTDQYQRNVETYLHGRSSVKGLLSVMTFAGVAAYLAF